MRSRTFFFTARAILATASSVHRSDSSSWEHNPDLIADLVSKLKKARSNSVDMDYLGNSLESILSPYRKSVEISNSEVTQDYSFTPRSPVIVYVDDPQVFNKYQTLKRVREERGSSESDERVSYRDVMQFLIQLDARLKEQEGIDPESHQNPVEFLRTFRKRNKEDEDIYETVEEPATRPREFNKKRRPKKEGAERVPKRYMSRESEEKESVERIFKRDKPIGDVGRSDSNFEKPALRLNFIRTPKPFVGKTGIYEEN